MSDLVNFDFGGSAVRVVMINREPWFLANDVCNVLEYKNPRRTIELHCKERGVTKRYTPTSSGYQDMIYINEPNLLRLIIKSKQPQAVRFEEWVFEEVLPSIRKTGGYVVKNGNTLLTHNNLSVDCICRPIVSRVLYSYLDNGQIGINAVSVDFRAIGFAGIVDWLKAADFYMNGFHAINICEDIIVAATKRLNELGKPVAELAGLAEDAYLVKEPAEYHVLVTIYEDGTSEAFSLNGSDHLLSLTAIGEWLERVDFDMSDDEASVILKEIIVTAAMMLSVIGQWRKKSRFLR